MHCVRDELIAAIVLSREHEKGTVDERQAFPSLINADHPRAGSEEATPRACGLRAKLTKPAWRSCGKKLQSRIGGERSPYPRLGVFGGLLRRQHSELAEDRAPQRRVLLGR